MNRIRELREEKGLKQIELGEILNVTKQAVSAYERGDREPDIGRICLLCDYFGCTADYLLGRTDNRLPAVSDDDASLIAAYHALPLEIRRAVDGLMAPYREKAEGKNAG